MIDNHSSDGDFKQNPLASVTGSQSFVLEQDDHPFFALSPSMRLKIIAFLVHLALSDNQEIKKAIDNSSKLKYRNGFSEVIP